MLHYFKLKISEARKLIVSKARAEEYEGVYRKLYENLDWFGEDELKKEKHYFVFVMV